MKKFRWQRAFILIKIIGAVLFVSCTSVKQNALIPATPSRALFEEATKSVSAAYDGTPTTQPTIEVISTEIVVPTITSTKSITSVSTESPEIMSTQESVTSNADVSNRLFMFVPAFGFGYSWLEPITKRRQDVDMSEYGIQSDSVGSAASLAFSHFSNQVAFWFRKPGEPGSLWLADIDMKEPKLIYVDEDEEFNSDISFPPKDVNIDWFPNDKYVLVNPTNQNAYPILVDVSAGSYQENWPWECNSVVVSPKTSQLALLCNHNGEQLLIEWNGELWTNASIPESEILWQWEDNYILPLSPSGTIPPWSPDGSKIARISPSEPNRLEIITNTGDKTVVHFEVDALFPYTIRWTLDGKILVGGYKETWPASWFIVDSNTGKIIWSLENTNDFNFTVQQQTDILAFGNGDISALGDFVGLSTNRTDIPSGNQLLLVDVKNNQYLDSVANIGHGLSTFAWER